MSRGSGVSEFFNVRSMDEEFNLCGLLCFLITGFSMLDTGGSKVQRSGLFSWSIGVLEWCGIFGFYYLGFVCELDFVIWDL
jgi:hypothetical protein